MTNQQGAPEALRPITRYEVVDCIDSKHVPAVIPNGAGPWVRYEDHMAALVEAQQPAKAESLRQILTDPENQPNQYGVQFLMHGPKMAFKIGARQFTLVYEPDEPGEFEFMRDALISAFSIFTPDVKLAQQPAPSSADEGGGR